MSRIVAAPTNGAVVVNVDGTVDYTHDGSETLSDSFTYSIGDLSGVVSNVATVTIAVTPLNDLPVANADSGTVIETCSACGGGIKVAALAHPCARGIRASMHIIACIEDPVVIEKILTHLKEKALPIAAPLLPESRAPPQAGWFD